MFPGQHDSEEVREFLVFNCLLSTKIFYEWDLKGSLTSSPKMRCTASAQRSSLRRASMELREPIRPKNPRMNVQRNVLPS